MTLINLKLSEFLDVLASNSPAPGGGSAAALAGTAGLALLGMACQLTLGKKKFAEVEEPIRAALAEVNRLRAQITPLIDRDAAAFNGIMAAYRLPNGNAEEQASRKIVIEHATKIAIQVPFETLSLAAEGLQYAAEIAKRGNPNAISDIGTGAHLLFAAASGALLNINVNLHSLDDRAYVLQMNQEAQRILLKADMWNRVATMTVAQRMFSDRI